MSTQENILFIYTNHKGPHFFPLSSDHPLIEDIKRLHGYVVNFDEDPELDELAHKLTESLSMKYKHTEIHPIKLNELTPFFKVYTLEWAY